MYKDGFLRAFLAIFLPAVLLLSACTGGAAQPTGTPAPGNSGVQPTVASALPAATASPVPTRTPAPTLTPTPLPGPVGQEDTGWNLVFHDDFSSGKLDDSKWVTCFWWDKNGCTIASNHELQWYQPANVMIMEEGGLALQAQKNQVTGSDGTVYPYTSGVITTGRKVEDKSQPVKFAFQYGYAEIQAWVPSGKGLLPAFWLLPANNNSKPEIDVMEVLGDKPTAAEMHFHFQDASSQEQSFGDAFNGPDFSAGWHTFALLWEPDRLVWFVDGVQRQQFADAAHIPAQPMYMLLNLAVGGNWPGDPASETAFPSTYRVKYVRVWQHSDLAVLSAAADASVDSSKPEQNFGKENTLSSDGDPKKITYLKFDGSSLAGRHIASAMLQFQTTGDPGGGSTDTYGIFVLSDSSWQETTITFHNSQEVTGAPVGVIDHAGALNQVYQVPLDAAALQARLGSVFTLAIQSLTGQDGLYMVSRDSDLPGVQLILQFAPGTG